MTTKKPSCPSVVRIGIQDFQIVEHNSQDDPLLAEGNYGYTQDIRNIIVLDKDLPESKKRVTVWHEIMHACRFTFDGSSPKKLSDYEDWEHHFIAVWENSLLMVLVDNPELTRWLLQSTKKSNENS